MKQTLQSETSNRSNVFTVELVSSTKGAIQTALFIPMNVKHFLAQQSMKQHDNDLDPGSSAANSFCIKSCCPSVLPGNARTPDKSPTKGHSRIPFLAGYNFLALDSAMAENLSSERRHIKDKTSAGNPGMILLNLETKLPRSDQHIVATKFQLHSKGQLMHPIRAVLLQPPADLVKTKFFNGLVCLSSIGIIKLYCRTFSHFFQKLCVGLLHIGQLPGEIYFQWGRSIGLKQRLEL